MLSKGNSLHFGVLPFTGTGHLNPLIVLAQELKNRGHRVTFFEKPKIEERVRQAGLEFVALRSENLSPPKSPPDRDSGIWTEILTLRFNVERVIRDIKQYLQQTPTALKDAGVDVLIINEIALTGPTVAQLLGTPYFLVSTSVPHHVGWSGSSWFTGRRSSTSIISWLESYLLELSALRVRGPICRALDAYRRGLGFGPLRKIHNDYRCLAYISQLPRCLDFKSRFRSPDFFHTGPWISPAARPQVDFPWDRLDGRPLVYATLGTTRNIQPRLFRMIAEACSTLGVQLVISLGKRFDPASFGDLPGQPLVTRFAPQLELLKLAQIVISHGGPNTTFEALMEGKPLIVIPLAYDQPAIAKRLAKLQLAVVLPVQRISALRIRRALVKILHEPQYRDAAELLQQRLRMVDGPSFAVDIITKELREYFAHEPELGPELGIDRVTKSRNDGRTNSTNASILHG
jgi:zeaxanthin glucosyltransferase